MKRLVLLGGGHAHIEVLRDFVSRPDDAVSITLVSPFPDLLYTGMLPGCVAGHYTRDEIAIDLVRLAARAHAAFVRSSAVLVNPAMREVICADGTVMAYDVLSFDIGSVPVGDVPGRAAHTVPIRPLHAALSGVERLFERARRGEIESVSIVGGGAGGVELAFAIDHRFRRDAIDPKPHVRIITDTPRPLPEFPEGARRRLRRLATARGIGSHTGAAVVEVGPRSIRLEGGLEFASDATIWVAGAGAPEIFRDSGIATDARGFLSVNERLQSISHPQIFGAGDCATNEADPRPKAGVFAVRAGPKLAANLRAALAGTPLEPWKTRRRFLVLLSTGDQHAIGSWGPLAWEGDWAWRWKDRIDREFVAKYQ